MKTSYAKKSVCGDRVSNNRKNESDEHPDIHSNNYIDPRFGADNTPKREANMRTKSFLRRVRKRTVTLLRKIRSCFRPHVLDVYDEACEDRSISAEGFGAYLNPKEDVSYQEQSVKTATEENPCSVVIPRTVSSAWVIEKETKEVLETPVTIQQEASVTHGRSSNPPSLNVESEPSSSSYSFFKDDLPRRIRSSPPVEKPTISIEAGTVASLRKILSEHHVLRSYSHDVTEGAGTEGDVLESPEKGCTSILDKEEAHGESQRHSINDIRAKTSSQMDLQELDPKASFKPRDQELIERERFPAATSTGDICSGNSLHLSVTCNSSAQLSSLMSAKSVNGDKSCTSSADMSVSGVGGGRNCQFESENSSGNCETREFMEVQDTGMISQGLEKIVEGAKWGAGWVYQALCSLCSNDDQEHGGLIII